MLCLLFVVLFVVVACDCLPFLLVFVWCLFVRGSNNVSCVMIACVCTCLCVCFLFGSSLFYLFRISFFLQNEFVFFVVLLTLVCVWGVLYGLFVLGVFVFAVVCLLRS